MNRQVFIGIGVVGLGLVAAGWIAVRADAPDREESRVTMAQLPKAVTKTLKREAAGGQIGEIDMNIGDHKVTYEADVSIHKMNYATNIPIGTSLLKRHFADIETSVAQFFAHGQATSQHGAGYGGMSCIGENVFLDIRTAIRWMSIVALSIFAFVMYKAYGSDTIKSKKKRTDTTNKCPKPQIDGL
ncbi:MAG: hypothetical protein M0Z50_14685 [Planctomycetia bacterium]|nr:hypothetical protein [Planctomycetia bacterium]